jgi:uracil-DNA glycosylase family 4
LKQNRGFLFWRAWSTRTGIDPGAGPGLAFARKRFGNMTSLSASTSIEPGRNCPLCPRLAEFRAQARAKAPDWHNAPVASFGDANAQLLIVGLAPGLQGANRTGRPFTGDYAGDLLYATLLEYGFAKGVYQARPDDGLKLVDCRISNAVRCVPPQNKPLPAEINTCRQFLVSTIATMPRLRAIIALGRIAHESTLKALGLRNGAAPFAHGAVHGAGAVRLYDSYHCSRYNTNTRVLTPEMFRNVFAKVRRDLDS